MLSTPIVSTMNMVFIFGIEYKESEEQSRYRIAQTQTQIQNEELSRLNKNNILKSREVLEINLNKQKLNPEKHV